MQREGAVVGVPHSSPFFKNLARTTDMGPVKIRWAHIWNRQRAG
jgi:hypothetical protein